MGEAAQAIISTVTIGPQVGPQSDLLSCPCEDIMFGGARGGGKSYGMLLDWAAHEKRFGGKARGILFRRTMPELEDLILKSQEIFPWLGAGWKDQKKLWIFPSGAVIRFRYLDRDSHADNYQGHEYTWMDFDELGNWPSPAPIDKLRACLRSAHNVQLRMVSTCNPGGPGHNWVKAQYVSPVPPYTVQEVRPGWRRVFIPARLEDNRILVESDPHYIERLKDSGPEWLVKAWLNGDWDIIAGGAFDDVWNGDLHVLGPFPIPKHWRIDRSFDWGSSKPFSVGWWAESDGTEVEVAEGVKKSWPAGTLFRIAEWYGWNGKPNEGCRMIDSEVAMGIKKREAEMGLAGRVSPGPADSSIFDETNVDSPANIHARCGIRWEKADKSPGSRARGLEVLRRRFKAGLASPMEDPGLFVFETCRQFIRTVPVLPLADGKMDDVDTHAEDHIYDECRYRALTPKRTVTVIKRTH